MSVENPEFREKIENIIEEKSEDNLEKTKKLKNSIYERARKSLEATCDQHENPEERVEKILKDLDVFFGMIDKKILPDEVIQNTKNEIGDCSSIRDREKFIERIMQAIRPVLDVRKAHAAEFEEAHAKAMNEAGNFIALNRLVSYGKDGSIIHIHHTVGETVTNKKSQYSDAMKKLAQIVNDDPEVQTITATSWIVAEHPKMFARSGFTVEELDEETKRKYFAHEERSVKRAAISREDFLKNFLKR